MGLDPVTLSAIIGGAGRIGASIFAPQGQMLSSFENDPTLNPGKMLLQSDNAVNSVFGPALARAFSPVDMSDAYVQSPPSFTGGGMPVPVGVTGSWGAGKPAVASPPSSSLPSFGPVGDNTPLDPGPNAGNPFPLNPFPTDPTNSPSPLIDANPANNANYPNPPLTNGVGPISGYSTGSLFNENGSGSAGSGSGPQRLAYQSPSSQSLMSPSSAGSGGGGNPQAIGAVTLLLKLAEEQSQMQPRGVTA